MDCNDCPLPTVLPPHILTGVIPAARCIGNATNPVSSTQTIQFTRTVRFDATTALSAHVTYTPDGNGGIKGMFMFMGSVPPQGDLVSIEPTVETWIPSPTPNTIIGHFVMCWVKTDGSWLCGDVSSEYVAEGRQLSHPLFRFITFENTSLTGTSIHQEENIVLFASVGD